MCREELGRVFSRKLSLSTRSADLIRDVLQHLDLDPSRKRTSRARPPLTHARQPSAPKDDVTIDMVNSVILTLKKDIEIQKLLDECILDAVTRKCWKARWVRSPNMRIEMRRFVGFVIARVGVLGSVRGEVGVGVGRLVLFCEGVEGGRG